ncbi:MAG TPA: hypothetical protein ENI33_07460 [Thermoplasmatales archaeon]|nr:hypothetical protein [Thermoplasmatales archaeon]
MFDRIEINPYYWNNNLTGILTDAEIEKLIDDFLSQMPVNSINKKEIRRVLKNICQLSIILAKFTFKRDIVKEKRGREKEIHEILKKAYFVFPFENHFRLIGRSESLINWYHFLFSIKLYFGDGGNKDIKEILKSATVVCGDKNYNFQKVKSTLCDNEFYIFFKMGFLQDSEGSKNLLVRFRLKKSYDVIEKIVRIYYKKDDNGVWIKMGNNERFIESGYKDDFFVDEFQAIHTPLFEENVEKETPNLKFRSYNGKLCLDSSELIVPIWFQKS